MAQITDGEALSSVRTTLNSFLTDLTGIVTPATGRANLGLRTSKLTGGDQTTTSASATNITDLVISVEANTRYLISGGIRVGCSSTGGVKLAVDIPASASMFITGFSRSNSGTAFTLSNITVDATLSGAFSTTGTSSAIIYLSGEISIGASAGNVQFMFASGVGGETSTVYQLGSFVRLEKL